MSLKQEEKKYKLLIVGDENIGKSSILKRFITDKYNSIYEPTIGLDVQSFTIFIDNQKVSIMSLDISGQKKFNILIPLYSNNVDIILLVYDITNLESFNSIENWIYLLNKINNEKNIIGLIGNKIDLEHNRKVKKKDAKKYADKKHFFFHEVSAFNGEGIKELFSNILSEQIKNKFLKAISLNQIEEKFGINNDDDILPIYIDNEDKNTEKISDANKIDEKNDDKKGLCKCVDCLIF